MNPEEKAKLLETLDLILKHLQSQSSNSGSDYKVVLYLVPIFGIVFGSALLFFVFIGGIDKESKLSKQDFIKKKLSILELILSFRFDSYLCRNRAFHRIHFCFRTIACNARRTCPTRNRSGITLLL